VQALKSEYHDKTKEMKYKLKKLMLIEKTEETLQRGLE
jgi:hypothetical protein